MYILVITLVSIKLIPEEIAEYYEINKYYYKNTIANKIVCIYNYKNNRSSNHA